MQQVAHIPGALFFDVDGIADRTTKVSWSLFILLFLTFFYIYLYVKAVLISESCLVYILDTIDWYTRNCVLILCSM